MKPTRRQLAVQFVAVLGSVPTSRLAKALIEAALDAGWTKRDLPSLITAVEHELHRRHSVIEVRLRTAHKLPESVLNSLAEEVAAEAKADQYAYTHTVDPSLLGGFEAETDGLAIRSSIRHSLKQSGVFNG